MVTQTDPLPPAPDPDDGEEDFNAAALLFTAAMIIYQAQQNVQAGELNDLATAMAAYAASAVNAPGTNATSTAAVAIGQGSKSFPIQAGKLFVPGMWLMAVSAADPSKFMLGPVSAYTSGSGALALNVQYSNGAGSPADWIISISPPVLFKEATKEQIWAGTSSLVTMTPAAQAAALANVAFAFASSMTFNGAEGIRRSTTVTGNLTLPNPTSLVPGYVYRLLLLIGGAGGFSLGFGSNWEFVGDVVPTLSQTAGLTDVLRFELLESGKVLATLTKGYVL